MNTTKYSDISLSFTPNPGQVLNTGKGDLIRITDDAAVKQSVRNLFNLSWLDKPFHPEIAMNIRSLLFENLSITSKAVIQRKIATIISQYEPRITVQDIYVNVFDDSNALTISVSYTIINKPVLQTVEIYLERVR